MIIPLESLSEATLNNLIREFVLREGTDYGAEEISLDTKVEQILHQLKAGKLVITYSEEYETCSISRSDKFE